MSAPNLYRFFSLFIGVALCVALLSASVTQEVPRGSLHGFVTMTENGKHLPKASVTLEEIGGENLEDATRAGDDQFQPIIRHEHKFLRYETDKSGRLTISNIDAGVYTVEIDA